MALNYENIILISHEDTSKDITKKGGDKVTSIKPNLQDKAANKVAGMVDIVARVIADDNKRVLSFKTNEVIFGGGRLSTSTNEIDLDYDTFLAVYEEANKAAVAKMKGEPEPASSKSDKADTGRKGRGKKETTPEPEKVTDEGNLTSEPSETTVPSDEPVQEEKPAESEPAKEEAPKEEAQPRSRKRRGEN